MTDTGPKVAPAISEAQSIIEAAEKRAEDVRSKAEKAHEAARELGYRIGFEQGRLEAVQEAVAWLEVGAEVHERLATEAARLALTIAKTVIGEYAKLNPELIKKMAITALQQSVVGESAEIIVNPADLEILKSAHSKLQQISGSDSIIYKTDEDISRGGCLVKSKYGEVDARIETLLEVISDRLGFGDGNARF